MTLSIEILLFILAFSKHDGLDYNQLSIAIRNGDHNAFKTFYDAHYSSLYRFMLSRGMDHDEAEDLIQKAFLLIWEKRDGIDETKSLKAYLFQIAYTRMLNHIEYHSKFNDGEIPDTDLSSKNPEDDLDYKQLLNHLKQIIAQMPEKRRMVFELSFMKQFTYREVAEAMDISVKTVENHMALAFKDVRTTITKIYGAEILDRI